MDRRSGDSPVAGCCCDGESVVGGSVGVDAGPEEVCNPDVSDGNVGLDAGPAGISGAATAGTPVGAGAAVEGVGVAEDTGSAASEADETGPAIVAELTVTRVGWCATTLR